MRNHHALWPRRGAAGVIDRKEIVLAYFSSPKFSRALTNELFIFKPSPRCSFERDKMLHSRQLRTHAVNSRKIISMGANHFGAAVIDEINKVVRREPVVNRHQHGPD